MSAEVIFFVSTPYFNQLQNVTHPIKWINVVRYAIIILSYLYRLLYEFMSVFSLTSAGRSSRNKVNRNRNKSNGNV